MCHFRPRPFPLAPRPLPLPLSLPFFPPPFRSFRPRPGPLPLAAAPDAGPAGAAASSRAGEGALRGDPGLVSLVKTTLLLTFSGLFSRSFSLKAGGRSGRGLKLPGGRLRGEGARAGLGDFAFGGEAGAAAAGPEEAASDFVAAAAF